MDRSILGLIEWLLFVGAVFGFVAWELYSLRRGSRDDAKGPPDGD